MLVKTLINASIIYVTTAKKPVTTTIIHSLISLYSFEGDTCNISRLRFFTNITYFDRFKSYITTINASKNITNKLKKFDRDKLFAVISIFINFHDGFDGPTGEIDTKNSYIRSKRYNTMLKSNTFRSHIYHVSVANNMIL